MSDRQVTLAIIGAGSADMSAWQQARKFTDDVVLIEGDRYGTTCARVGCMPSKLLIASALRAREVARVGAFGIDVHSHAIDGRAVMHRVRRERDRFVSHVLDTVMSWPEDTRIQATARFIDDHTLALSDGSTLSATHILIATGSEPRMPDDFARLRETVSDRVCTSEHLFEWQDLPESVAVFGGGVIGLELGQALHHLGVRVRIFGQDGDVAQLSDPAVLKVARSLFCDEYAFVPDAHVTDKYAEPDGVRIQWREHDAHREERFDYLLVAVGRVPQLSSLELGNTSLALDGHGVPRCDPATGQCGDSSTWLAGDASSGPPLLHLASVEGKAAAVSAMRSDSKAEPVERPLIGVTFTEPQIMNVGRSHADLLQSNEDFAIGQVDWSDQGRARVMGTDAGLLRLYGSRESQRLLGAEMIGPAAEHLAHLLAWCIQSRLTVRQCLARPFYRPCVEEGVRSALRDLHDAMHDEAKALSTPHSIDCGPGC